MVLLVLLATLDDCTSILTISGIQGHGTLNGLLAFCSSKKSQRHQA
uniref:Uncharacterized protein n=1 Tax=Setaria viridis TaxID=4556 RepID=A0A4U6U4A6_SETVI|nr:hypothetical protein SEVIR_7G146403v2 [Setaria viridis]